MEHRIRRKWLTDGQPVILRPYDVHCFDEATSLLVNTGYRVIVRLLRGFGPTRFLFGATLRSGEQLAFGVDIVALMDALNIKQAILGGFDWGGRGADLVAALWPERCKRLVSVSGYQIINLEAAQKPFPPRAELGW